MYVENAKAAHDSTCPAYGYSKDDDTFEINEDTQENKRCVEKRLADYIRVLRPGILVSAPEEVEHKLLVSLQGRFHRATPRPTIESLVDDVLRTRARTIVLVDAALDVDEVTRKTRCYVLTLRSGGAA